MDLHTYIHTYIHIYIHIYIHKYIQTCTHATSDPCAREVFGVNPLKKICQHLNITGDDSFPGPQR